MSGIVVSASRARAYARKIVYRCSRCSTMGDPILVSPMRKVMIPRQCPRYASRFLFIPAWLRRARKETDVLWTATTSWRISAPTWTSKPSSCKKSPKTCQRARCLGTFRAFWSETWWIARFRERAARSSGSSTRSIRPSRYSKRRVSIVANGGHRRAESELHPRSGD